MKSITCLTKVNLEPDDIILWEIDQDKIDVCQAQEIFRNLKKIFPNHEVIVYLSGTIHITKEKSYEIIPMEIET